MGEYFDYVFSSPKAFVAEVLALAIAIPCFLVFHAVRGAYIIVDWTKNVFGVA